VEEDGIRKVDRIRTLNSQANLRDKKQIFGLICLKPEDSSILNKNIQRNLRNVNSKGLKLTLKNAFIFLVAKNFLVLNMRA
jgi:hypothetical protein